MRKRIKVSVVVPVYNGEKTILRLLRALEKQDFSHPFEVIVCDDGSRDNTVRVVRKFAKRARIPVRVFANPHRGPAWQRNLGAKKARGEVIAFTDSDCIPGKNWLSEITRPIFSGEAVGVQGTYRTYNKQSVIARFEGYEIEKRHERMKRERNIDFIGTFSAAYRKDVFLKFGGFDESFPVASGEDPELSYRIAKHGYKLLFAPRAWVYHEHPDTLKKYLKQKFYRAYWRVLMYSRHPDKMKGDSYTGLEVHGSVLFAGLFYCFLLLSPFNPALLVASFLCFLGFAAVNLSDIAFMAKKEKKMLVIAPFLLFLRTTAWILGFVAGLVNLKFLKRVS